MVLASLHNCVQVPQIDLKIVLVLGIIQLTQAPRLKCLRPRCLEFSKPKAEAKKSASIISTCEAWRVGMKVSRPRV